jgi:PmbA protein
VTNLTDAATQLLDLAMKAGAEQAAATAAWNDGIDASARDGVIEEIGRSESLDIGIRVIVGAKQACVSASSDKPDVLSELAERAVAMARETPEDPFCGLADAGALATEIPNCDLFDASETDADALRDMALTADNAAREVEGIQKTDGSSAGWSRRRAALVQSNGFSAEREGSFWGASCTAIAGEGLGMERDYAWTSARFREDLRAADEVGREAAERTLARLNPRKAKTCSVPVIYDQRLASSLLGSFLGSINASSVARGSSYLKDKLGKGVFAKGISIVDDPHRRRGLSSRPYDGEGLPTRRLDLIEDGVLTTWLLDTATGRQLGMESTGSASFGIGSAPRPSSSNVTLAPGQRTQAAMIADLDEGFLITEMLGASINATTGDYSRGASGFWIEKGEITYPVTEATVAGNLIEIFANLEPADDLPLDRAVASPSVLVTGLQISGE